MYTPQFNDGQFVAASTYTAAAALTSSGVALVTAATHTPGVVGAGAVALTPSALTLEFSATAGFAAVFGSGVVAQALGNTAGAVSGSATIDFSGLVPASGNPPVTAYLVASAAQVQEQPVAILGPPTGHPDYSATFAPYVGYTQVSDTLQLAATLTPPDNFANIEIARTVLSAGQVNITVVSTAYQPLAGSVLAAGQAAANVGALGGCLSGLLPNPLLALVGDVAAPGYIEIPSAAGTLILQWFTQTFTPSQTVLEVALPVPFPNGYLAGAAVDSPLTLSPPTGGTFKYTVFEGGAGNNANVYVSCDKYYVDQGGAGVVTRSFNGTGVFFVLGH
jgi:hypothetical protein